jgi:hypothetical protein
MVVLRAASPLRIGDVTLVPVERAEIRSSMGEAGCWVGAFKAVHAIVIADASGVRALAADSSDIALDDLIRNTPNLGDVLAELRLRRTGE